MLYFSVTENLIHSNGFEWLLMVFGCMTGVHDRGHVTPDSWHLTHHTWYVTADTCHVTPDTWFFSPFSTIFVWRFFFMSVLLTKHAEKFSVSHMRDLCCLGKGSRKKPLNPQACSYLPQTLPHLLYCDRLRLFSFSAVFFKLFGMLGTLWNQFCRILG